MIFTIPELLGAEAVEGVCDRLASIELVDGKTDRKSVV